MSTLNQQLEEWIISETHLVADRHLKLLPESSEFSRLTEGKNKKIWKYIVTNIRSRCTAEKIKRVLKVKRDQEEPENPYPVTSADQIIKRIERAKEKRLFIESSLSDLRREIDNTENNVRSLNDEISVLNQKSAMLELIISENQGKCKSLNSIRSLLCSYVEKNSKNNTQFYLALNFPLEITNTLCKKSKFGEDRVFNEVRSILKQIFSFVTDSKSESFGENLKKHANQMMNTISMADLFLILKEISNESYLEIMSNEAYSSIKGTHSSSKSNSEKYLQEMKLSFIQSSFASKKAKNDILQLQEEKESLLEKFSFKSEDAAFEKRYELFQKMADNAGLSESIKFLEDNLHNEQYETKMLTDYTNGKNAKSDRLELTVQNFYSNLDTLCMLLKSGAKTHEHVINSLLRLHKFANEQMFSNITQTLKEYPFQIGQNLTFDTQTMWTVFEKNNLIKPLIPRSLSMQYVVPDNFKAMLDVSGFESECVVARKVKNTKNELLCNVDSEFKHDDSDLSDIYKRYIGMTEMLQKMQDKLELCNISLRKNSEVHQQAQLALRDWWEQGAQFIPHIVCDDKSLKMWLDILHVLPELVERKKT